MYYLKANSVYRVYFSIKTYIFLQIVCLKYAIYVTPANQFPTGVEMSLERRQQLNALAQQTGAYILEDGL